MQKKNYVQEILEIIHSGLPQAELAEKLSDYHENDLADALAALTPDERQKLYAVLGVDTVAEIFSYLDDAEPYLKELPSEKAANVVSHMDSDDAVASGPLITTINDLVAVVVYYGLAMIVLIDMFHLG